jgi:hemoglobin
MRRVLHRWLTPLAIAALALCLGGTARAADPPREAHGDRGPEEKMYNLLRDLINEGADLYNAGDYAGCYRLWEGALKTMRPFIEPSGPHAAWGKAVEAGFAEAQGQPFMWQRAWALRKAMDKVRDDIHPPKKGEAAATTAPPAGRPPVGGEPSGTRSPGAPPVPGATRVATLWDRLGQEAGVRKVIDQVTDLAAKDPKVDFTRGGKIKLTRDDVAKFKEEMVDWVSAHTGGPLKYTGKNMKVVHEGMHITNAQFDALAAHIRGVLEKNRVQPDDVKAVLGAVEATRKDIVEAKAEEEPTPVKKPEEKKPSDTKEEKKDEKKPEANKAGATVEGRVTYKGKPLPGGTITLTGKDGAAISGAIDADGAYKVEGVKPGTYAITLNTSVAKDKAVAIPKQYTEADKSGLMVNVTDGRNNCDLDLK